MEGKTNFKGAIHAIYYLFKELNLFSHLLNFKTNDPVLLLKTIFKDRNCSMSSVAKNGKDGHVLKRLHL